MLKLVSELDFVIDNNLEVSELSKNNKYLLSGVEKDYILDIYSSSKINKILKRNECLNGLNSEFLNAFTYVKVDNLNDSKCYIITEKLSDCKDNFNFEYSYEKGFEIGKYIRQFHSTFQSRACGRWSKHYSYRINKVLHKYGLGSYRGEFDYIVFDFLDANKYLISERTSTTIIGISSIEDIIVDDTGRFKLLEDYKILRSDSYFEFITFNSKDVHNTDILTGIIDGYFGNRVPRTFFKLLAIYTIVERLYEVLDKDEVDFDELKIKIEEINEIYDKFSTIYPIWYLDVKNRLKEVKNV